MRFEWDEAKNRTNQSKHGVTFSEAQSVFYEDSALLFDDPDHSDEEQRFLLVGYSFRARVLVVVHCWRKMDEVIRIISARQATRSEYEMYHANGGLR